VTKGPQLTAPVRPLDSEVKKQVKNWVLRLRGDLEKDLGLQLRRLGIEQGKPAAPLAKLDYLNADDQEIRRHLDALLAHETRVEGSREAGYLAVRHELAYTFLNRLVGLRCMEARGLLYIGGEQTEVVTTKPEYGGRSRFLRDMRASGGAKYKDPEEGDARLLRDGLEWAFRSVTEEIGVLFDPDHEYSRLWPSYPALKKVIQKINEGLPAEAFASPDFLGWVYQFFNVEEKERIREKTKGKPTTPYELAVINQFYTPDWIVKFLVDNTLGRVWREMHPDTRLTSSATDGARSLVAFEYLVPQTGEDRRQEVRQARDLRLLDPACGTMHFGQYAFVLLYEMYLEEMEYAGKSGWPKTPSVENPEKIPNLILEHNLFGIDIDARAIQIAALALLLTTKELAKAHGLDPSSVHVRKMNLVAADAVSVGQEELTKFLERANGRISDAALRRQLIGAIWRNLEHVAQLGSLIQVGEDLASAITNWVEKTTRSKRGGTGQMALIRPLVEAQASGLKDSLLSALHKYAADNRLNDAAQRLFAEDTATSFELLDVLSAGYDTVVMNPPYDDFIPATKKYVDAAYPLTSNDIYAAFIERGAQLLRQNGYIGALVSRTFSSCALYLSRARTRRDRLGGRWEVGVLQKLPVPPSHGELAEHIASLSRKIYDVKASWDEGNEISTRFKEPWLTAELRGQRPDRSLTVTLDALLAYEAAANGEVQSWYAELDAAVFDAYGLSLDARETVLKDLGECPAEIVWPQMEGKSAEQKRIEHIWRLLSFCAKRVIDSDHDGIVPLVKSSNEPPLEERVLTELGKVVGTDRLHEFEGEIASELRKRVPGHKRADSVGDWLTNVYFEYHARLYKNRPIYWHLASSQQADPAFGVIVHYHRFGKDALRKLRGSYVRGSLERFERDLGYARAENRTEDALELQRKIEEVRAFDKKLQDLEKGNFPIRVPWKEEAQQPKGWDPDIDDGVKVDILPLQSAGLLRIARVVSAKSEEDE